MERSFTCLADQVSGEILARPDLPEEAGDRETAAAFCQLPQGISLEPLPRLLRWPSTRGEAGPLQYMARKTYNACSICREAR